MNSSRKQGVIPMESTKKKFMLSMIVLSSLFQISTEPFTRIGTLKVEATENTTLTYTFPSYEVGSWNLQLVNSTHTYVENGSKTLVKLPNGESVDSRIMKSLQELLNDAEANGFDPAVISGYRSNEVQQAIWDEKVQEYVNQGYSQSEAEKLTSEYVAVPGTSEHETGLAVDINNKRGLETAINWLEHKLGFEKESQNNQDLYQWLAENSYKYGFILRYPEGKEEITGVNYEYWHFRYVGKEAATQIYNRGIALEEYLGE
jgi:D-alanyl-D-alanine carboxypeptidase